jgi:hypothetical protein
LSAPTSLASDISFTLPATDGSSGQALVTNGSGVLSFASAGLAWQTIVTASTLTAVAGRGYWINTTSNACTITLPASATNGDTIILADYLRTWGTNAVTINQNSLKFQGYTSPNPIYNTTGQSVTLVYSGATQGWIPTVDDDVTLETPQSYSIDFLVVAGGGGGGSTYHGGGGGGGGFRTSTQTVTLSTVITATVGDGGAGGVTLDHSGISGSSSSISGSGLTTITSAGGGGGGNNTENINGLTGGSGGGASGGAVRSGSSGNTPATSPSQGNSGGSANADFPAYGAGGGGGASAVGGNGTSTNGGNGGNGSASSITGSSVTYAGGGGGSAYPDGGATAGTGGTGGGGNGSKGAGSAGTVNLGGGGGGSERSPSSNGGAGGKGVVILSVPTANYSGTKTGSPTVTTSGSNTILTFTGSGSYTA